MEESNMLQLHVGQVQCYVIDRTNDFFQHVGRSVYDKDKFVLSDEKKPAAFHIVDLYNDGIITLDNAIKELNNLL